MLKSLQKALGVKPEAQVNLDATIVSAVEAAVAGLQAEFAEFKQSAEASVASLTEQLAAANALIGTYREAADAATAAAAAAEAEAAATKLAARKEKVVAAVGTDRADALMAVSEGMEDATFDAVLAALTVTAVAEANSPLFKEAGVEATTDAALVEESPEMKELKARYNK